MSRNGKETSPRKEALRLQQTVVDIWSLKEKYHLAAAVAHSGNGNWTSVSRLLSQSFDKNKDERPSDWFSTKNCALQYSKLLDEIPAPERKKKRRLTASDDSSSQRRADKIETHEEAIVKVLREKRLQEAIIQYGEMKAFLTQIEKFDHTYRDANANEKEKTEAFEAAKSILEEEAEKKIARVRWMKQREDQIRSLQAQINSLIKKPRVLLVKDAAVEMKALEPKSTYTQNKIQIKETAKETSGIETIEDDDKIVMEDTNELDTIRNPDVQVVQVKFETPEVDHEEEIITESLIKEEPTCSNDQSLRSEEQTLTNETLDVPSDYNPKSEDTSKEKTGITEFEPPQKMETIDTEIEVYGADENQGVKIESEEQESKVAKSVPSDGNTESQLERETDEANEVGFDCDLKVSKKDVGNDNGNSSDHSNSCNSTRYIVPKLSLEISKYEKAKKSESDRSRSSTPKPLYSIKSEDLLESEDERRAEALVKRRSGRKSDATYGPASDYDSFKIFRKEALLLLNNIHLQRCFTKLMPRAKDLKACLHTEVKSFTSIRFDVESGQIRSMEELRWNVLHTLTSMAFFYRFNQKEYRETQSLYKEFNSMIQKQFISSGDFSTTSFSLGSKQRRSSTVSDVEQKRRKV